MEKRIQQIIDEDRFDVYGIRVINGPAPEIGTKALSSYIWDDGKITDDQLDGASAIEIDGNIGRAMKLSSIYFGSTVLLIGGFQCLRGADDGEVVIRDAEILATWTR